MRDDPTLHEGMEEGCGQGLKICEDCLASCAGPVVYVDCTSCTGWRDAAIG
ncbi:hypothetical protein AB0F92_35115 [Kitasatospora aureofaciens]|uniref:hypothetical protein n=1 Tax=Kitasatospora aureofaciens TaxID=1894 RepID=UPI0033FB464D